MIKNDQVFSLLAAVLILFSASVVSAETTTACLASDMDDAVAAAATAGACNPDGAFIGASGLATQLISFAQSQKNRGRCQSALLNGRKSALTTAKLLVTLGAWTTENAYALANALKRDQLGDVCSALPGRNGDDKDNDGKPSPDQTPSPTPPAQQTPGQSLTAQFNTAVKQACCLNGQKVPEFGGCLIGTNGVVSLFVREHENDPLINQFKKALMEHLNSFISEYQCAQ